MIERADILRTNKAELEIISSWLDIGDLTIKDQLMHLKAKYDYEVVIATLGGDGAICIKEDDCIVQPVFEVDVRDTVGAGDGFLAGFISQYLSGHPIEYSMRYACAIGALTASKHGGTPDIDDIEIQNILFPQGKIP